MRAIQERGGGIEGSQLQDTRAGIHANSETPKTSAPRTPIDAGGEAAVGNFDEAVFEGRIAKGRVARQGDLRFTRAGAQAEATMATKGWRTNNFTLRGGQMWRKHSCLPRRHSCRRSLPQARRSVELRLDAARRSACATTAAVKLFLRCY